MQNLVVLMEPSVNACDTHLNGGNLILNRFCIDEDAAFELSGVNYLKKASDKISYLDAPEFKETRKVKGKEYPFLRYYFISRNLISMNN